MAFHVITAAYVLSGLDAFDFEDSWDNGVANWDLALLRTRLALVALRARPDLVVTLNPGATWAHQTYAEYWRTATWYYLSQSSHPVWFATRAGVGLLPGYADADIIRRLDDAPASASLETLLERYPPSARLQARLPPVPTLVDLSDIPAHPARATPCRDDGVGILDRTGDPGRR